MIETVVAGRLLSFTAIQAHMVGKTDSSLGSWLTCIQLPPASWALYVAAPDFFYQAIWHFYQSFIKLSSNYLVLARQRQSLCAFPVQSLPCNHWGFAEIQAMPRREEWEGKTYMGIQIFKTFPVFPFSSVIIIHNHQRLGQMLSTWLWCYPPGTSSRNTWKRLPDSPGRLKLAFTKQTQQSSATSKSSLDFLN